MFSEKLTGNEVIPFTHGRVDGFCGAVVRCKSLVVVEDFLLQRDCMDVSDMSLVHSPSLTPIHDIRLTGWNNAVYI